MSLQVILEGFDLELHIAKRCKNKMAKTLKPQTLQWGDGPRVVLDCKLRLLVFYAPKFWGVESQVRRNTHSGEHVCEPLTLSQARLLRALDTLVKESPLTPDDAGHSDRRIPNGSLQPSAKPGRGVYWSLFHHGPAQQNVSPHRETDAR